MPKISVIHPTVRAKQALDIYEFWKDRASDINNFEYIFAFNDNDEEAKKLLSEFKHISTPYRNGSVDKCNAAAAISSGEIIMQSSDDLYAPCFWDEQLITQLPDPSQEIVLKLCDGHPDHRKNIIKNICMTRVRYLKQGFWYHPDLFHLFSDNFYSEMAIKEDVVKDATQIVFEHRHPFYGKGKWDEHYEKSNCDEAYKESRPIFERLIKEYGIIPVTL